MLQWVVRAASASAVDNVVLATSDDSSDDELADYGTSLGIPVVRGPLEDVLGRYLLAIERYPCDAVLRLTADCPLLDPAVLDAVIGLWRADPTLDYVSNVLVRTLPRGYDAEVVRADALLAESARPLGPHREHVTSGVLVGDYRRAGVVFAPDASDLRVTLDTPEDAALLDAVAAALGGPADWRSVVAFLRANPHVARLNADVQQKDH